MTLQDLPLVLSVLFLGSSAQIQQFPSHSFWNRNVHATHQQGRAIASSSNSPGSFMIQMPFSVVSNDKNGQPKLPNRESGETRFPSPPASAATGLVNNVPTLVSIGDEGDKINFYTIKCSSGELCSSIIPAQVVSTTETPQRRRTAEEMRKYLRSYNLESGFGYSADNWQPDTASKYFIDEQKEKEKLRQTRQMRFRDFRDYEDFWPGSHLRPNRRRDPKKIVRSPSIFVEEGVTHNPASLSGLSSSWPRGVNIVTRPSYFPQRKEEGRGFAPQLPSPSFGNSLEWPYIDYKVSGNNRHQESPRHMSSNSAVKNSVKDNWRKKTKYDAKSESKNGGWRLFSTSTVSQLDKESGKWKQVSTGNNKVHSDKKNTYFPYENQQRPFPQYRPPSHSEKGYKKPSQGTTTLEQTATGLTVLGVTEENSYRIPSTSRPSSSYGSASYFPKRPLKPNYQSKPKYPRPSSNESSDPLTPVSASTHGQFRRGVVYKL